LDKLVALTKTYLLVSAVRVAGLLK